MVSTSKCSVVSLLLVTSAGILMLKAIMDSSWMKDELNINLKDYLNVVMPMIQKVMQQKESTDIVPSTETHEDPMSAFKAVNKYLEPYKLGKVEEMVKDISFNVKMNFGLKAMCFYWTLTGFQNPIKVFIPSIQLCIKNDIFTNPGKYNLPNQYTLVGKQFGFDDFNISFICIIIATIFVGFTCIFLFCKFTSLNERHKGLLLGFISMCCVFAAISAAAAVINVKANFELKEKYEEGRRMTLNQENDYGEDSAMEMMKLIHLKESVGCAFIYTGVGIALLLLTMFLNIVEFCMRPNEPVPYNNLKLQGI